MADVKKPRGSGRERIFRAAVEVLMESGLEAAQTRSVTERAGVGTGLLNHYFRWPVLRAAAWESVFEDAPADIRRADEAPRAAIKRFMAEAFAPEARLYWRLWIDAERLAPHDPPIAEALDRIRTQLRSALTRLLADGAADGDWQLPDPAATALRLDALRDGLAGLILAGDPAMNADKARQHLEALFAMECGVAGGG